LADGPENGSLGDAGLRGCLSRRDRRNLGHTGNLDPGGLLTQGYRRGVLRSCACLPCG
jgi:hypothetical protein